jgi:NAD(P)H-dependent FMN reductase
MTTNVLLICGSLQEKSANGAALDVVRGALLARDGIEVDEADEVASMPPFNPDHENDELPSVASFRARVSAADAVIIAAPEYGGALPGALKNALDWSIGAAKFYGKPVALISAGSTGGQYAREQLIRTLSWQGAHVVAHLGIGSPRTKSDEAGRITDRETIEAIEQLAGRVLDVLALPDDERLALVEAITTAVGVDPPAIAPVQR